MSRCASCKYITYDVVRGDRCSISGKRADNGKYCKNYEMSCETEEESVEENNARMLSVVRKNKNK